MQQEHIILWHLALLWRKGEKATEKSHRDGWRAKQGISYKLVRKDVLYKWLPCVSLSYNCAVTAFLVSSLHINVWHKVKWKPITNKYHRDRTQWRKRSTEAYISTKECAIFTNSHSKIFVLTIVSKLENSSVKLFSYKLSIYTCHAIDPWLTQRAEQPVPILHHWSFCA